MGSKKESITVNLNSAFVSKILLLLDCVTAELFLLGASLEVLTAAELSEEVHRCLELRPLYVRACTH